MKPLPSGSTIGIVGGGQLGRMSAQAAQKLGYKVHIFGGDADSPAGQVADICTDARYENEEAMRLFADAVDVVTFEFENVPHESLQAIEEMVAVYPKPEVLRTTRHRLREKGFINECGIATAPYMPVTSLETLEAAIEEIGTPAILKTCELGYDGKGQVKLDGSISAQHAWEMLETGEAVLEGFVPFVRELSIIVARNIQGEMRCFPLAHNIHKHHILDKSIVPAGASDTTERQAEQIATILAEKLDLVGIMAVELFVMEDGSLIVNELAPRPHNSGHWSMDGCTTSQFEQHIRAITGQVLGDTDITAPVEMVNLIGDDVLSLEQYQSDVNAKIHIYGKKEARPGRKMGHVNKVSA